MMRKTNIQTLLKFHLRKLKVWRETQLRLHCNYQKSVILQF